MAVQSTYSNAITAAMACRIFLAFEEDQSADGHIRGKEHIQKEARLSLSVSRGFLEILWRLQDTRGEPLDSPSDVTHHPKYI